MDDYTLACIRTGSSHRGQIEWLGALSMKIFSRLSRPQRPNSAVKAVRIVPYEQFPWNLGGDLGKVKSYPWSFLVLESLKVRSGEDDFSLAEGSCTTNCWDWVNSKATSQCSVIRTINNRSVTWCRFSFSLKQYALFVGSVTGDSPTSHCDFKILGNGKDAT